MQVALVGLKITCRKQSQDSKRLDFSRFQPLLHVAEALAPNMCIAHRMSGELSKCCRVGAGEGDERFGLEKTRIHIRKLNIKMTRHETKSLAGRAECVLARHLYISQISCLICRPTYICIFFLPCFRRLGRSAVPLKRGEMEQWRKPFPRSVKKRTNHEPRLDSSHVRPSCFYWILVSRFYPSPAAARPPLSGRVRGNKETNSPPQSQFEPEQDRDESREDG